MTYQLEPIPAFNDNYIWCLSNSSGQALIVDPGDAAPVFDHLRANDLELTAIFLTHHHFDHSGGIPALRDAHDVPVYGPEESPCKEVTEALAEGATAVWENLAFQVIPVPGHTLDHIAFFCSDPTLDQPLLFCGDTLFVGGCGRLFEGTPAQMQSSLARLRDLPGESRICCAHEYTLANLAFARAVMPQSEPVRDLQERSQAQREQGRPTVPGLLETEQRVNPFLRWDAPEVIKAAQHFGGGHGVQVEPGHPETVFAAVRRWKDQFKG